MAVLDDERATHRLEAGKILSTSSIMMGLSDSHEHKTPSHDVEVHSLLRQEAERDVAPPENLLPRSRCPSKEDEAAFFIFNLNGVEFTSDRYLSYEDQSRINNNNNNRKTRKTIKTAKKESA